MSLPKLQPDKSNGESHAEKWDSINRILSSPLFQGSESLSNLLRYLAEHSLQAPNETLKEHQIATELFNRDPSFDPRMDSIVRVHTSRLRTRLEEYYRSGAGRDDPWQVQLPRGGHTLVFSRTAPAEASPEAVQAVQAVQTPVAAPISDRAVRFRWSSQGVLLGALAVVGALAFWMGRVSNSALYASKVSPDVKAFWQVALPGAGTPLVVFSNAKFIGRPETGIRYLRPGEAETSASESYTGVGEVFAVDALHNVLGQLGRKFDLRRAQRLNWDEAKARELILVGSPSENLPVRDLQLEKDFAFRVSPGPVRRGDLAIVNLRPRAGEQQSYFASPSQPLTEDYALIVLTEGTTASQRVVLLAGTTTYGTEAAAEFVASPESLSDLWNKIGRNTRLWRLSVLLHAQVKGGVPLETNIIAVRTE